VTVYASRLWLETRQRVHPGLQKRYLRMLRHDLPNPLERLGGGSPVELVGPGDAAGNRAEKNSSAKSRQRRRRPVGTAMSPARTHADPRSTGRIERSRAAATCADAGRTRGAGQKDLQRRRLHGLPTVSSALSRAHPTNHRHLAGGAGYAPTVNPTRAGEGTALPTRTHTPSSAAAPAPSFQVRRPRRTPSTGCVPRDIRLDLRNRRPLTSARRARASAPPAGAWPARCAGGTA
jgi:hypothetical protein